MELVIDAVDAFGRDAQRLTLRITGRLGLI